MSHPEQHDVQPVVSAQQAGEPCTYNIPGATDRDIPQELIFNGKCQTADEYKQLVQLVYRLVAIRNVRVNGDQKLALNIKWISSNTLGDLLANVRASTPDLANVQNTLVGLFSVLTAITSVSLQITRNIIITCVSSFTNEHVNNALEENYELEGDQKANPEYKYILFVNRFIPACLDAIKFIHKKARYGVEFYYQVEHLKSDIHKLKHSYQRMLTSLQNRAEVNKLLTHVMMTQDDAMEKLREYSSYWDDETFKRSITLFPDTVDVYRDQLFYDETEVPDNDNLKSWVTKKIIYHNLLKAPNLSPQAVKVFVSISSSIDPIISGIRSFTPSSLEIAQEKAAFMKPSITKIRQEAEDFFQPGSDKSIGRAKHLLSQIRFKKEVIENLQMSGLVVDHQSAGVTPDELGELFVKIENELAQKEFETKVNEAKQRAANNELAKGAPQLQLPPLNGFSSWLNFRRAIGDIMPLHSNPLIKKQILLKSLRNKEDHSRCQSMDYDDGFKYLVQRYESSALIPGLIDELLRLSPATSDRQAYENLTQLISTTSMIQKYDQIDKLDSNARSKLTYILIHRDLQLDFLKDQTIFEKNLKKEFCPESDILDAISEASCLQSVEVETKRRTWWLEQMSNYLAITRELIKTKDTTKRSSNRSKGSSYSSQSQSQPQPQPQTQSFSAKQEEYKCPLCCEPHIERGRVLYSLSRCFRFQKMDVQQRISVVESKGHCKRCLRSKADGSHTNGCSIGKERNLVCSKCSPPSTTHHHMLHLEKQSQQTQPKKSPGGGGGRGGKGGSKGGKGRGQSKKGAYSTQSNNNPTNNTSNIDISNDCDSVTYKNSGTDTIGIPDDANISITTCSAVKIILDADQSIEVIGLLDNGSTTSYISQDLIEKLNLVSIGQWSGNMTTLHGSKFEVDQIYRITVADHNGKHHTIEVHGTGNIGYKRSLPNLFFKNLCAAFKLNSKVVQNNEGSISLLFGLIHSAFLATKMSDRHSKQFPGVYLWNTPLSNQLILSGGIKSRVKDNYRTLSFYSKESRAVPPCKTSVVRHKGCNPLDVRCNSYFSPVWKRYWSIALLLANVWLGPTPDSTSSRQAYLSSLHLPSTNLCGDRLETEKVLIQQKDRGYSFMKMSPALVSVEDSTGVSNLACRSCAKAMASCKRCAYLNSSLSIQDLEELEILTKSISVIETKEGKRIMVSYPLKDKALQYFSWQNSNREAARINAIKLRERLIKNKVLESYHEEMMKSLERNHISIFESYSPHLSPQLFLFQNFVLKESSVSQGCRPVCNSGTKNRSGHDLNNMTIAGPSYLCNGPAVFLSFRLHPVAFCIDISRCYRSLLCDEQTCNLRCFWWYKDCNDPASLCIFKYEVVTYGDRPAQCLLEISFRTIISPACKMDISKSINSNDRVVDDVCSSLRSHEEVDRVIEDLTQAFSQYGFGIKHAIKTHHVLEPQGVLGMLWSPTSDELSVTTTLNMHCKRRGKYSGKALSADNINTAVLDKAVIARISAQSFEYLNCMIGPIQSCLRILFSMVCKVLKDWVTPLHLVDKELDSQVRAILHNLVDLPKKIKAIPRCIIKPGYILRRICVASDAGKPSLACTFHLVTFTSNGKVSSSLCFTKSKIHHYSLPDAEFGGVVLGIKTLAEVLSFDCIARVIGETPMDIIMVTDSLCTANSLSPYKIHKETRPRNYSHIVYRQSTELCLKYPGLNISYTHLRGTKVPADFLTKLVPDPCISANASLYRFGPSEYQQLSWPSAQKVFLKFSQNEEPQYQTPVAEQDNTGSSGGSEVDETGSVGVSEQDQGGSQCMHCQSTDYCWSVTAATSTTPGEDGQHVHAPTHPYPQVGTLPYEMYTKLLKNCKSLVKVINVISRLIGLFSATFQQLSVADQATISFLVVVKSHQAHFKAEKTKQARPAFDYYNILRISTRLTAEDGSSLGIHHAPVLISHHDTRLVWLLINHAHLARSGIKSPIHLGPVFTLAKLRSGQYPVHITRARVTVENQIKKCVICRFAHARPTRAQLGSPRFIRHLHNNDIVYAVCSMDPLGPWYHRTHRTSKTKTRFYLLLLTCLVTKASNLIILEGLKREEIIIGFRQHCNQFRTPVELYVDKGSSVNPQPGSELWERYFHGERCTIHQVASSHQQNNFCERTVSIISRLLRTSFLQRDKLHFPNLTFCELNSLISTVIMLLNSRPIFATTSGSQVLTPNHLLKTHAFYQNPEDAETALSNLQMNFHNFYSQLKITHSIFVNIVKNAFRGNLATTHFLGVGKKAIFIVGDFVLIFRTDKIAVGLVVEPGPQYCVVKTAETRPPALANIHCNKLLLLHREANPEADSLPVLDLRNGSEDSNHVTSCFTQSFLAMPSNKALNQRFLPSVTQQ